ncbi:MAG: lipoyl synthase [Treponemataceae bacterium]|nr:lipoyl synthase [Treponemataceae bacterium]
MADKLSKPAWIRVKADDGPQGRQVKTIIEQYELHTVCEAALCPNRGSCWGAGTATFMILGSVCTRSCRFCAVVHGGKGEPIRLDEPEALAEAVTHLQLRYVVLTSVDRDDLPDRGATHYASCITAIKRKNPLVSIEVLIPDYQQEELVDIIAAGPDVIAHNIETVPSLQKVRDPRASYVKSCNTLKAAKRMGACCTKTSILLGLGEDRQEVLHTMNEMRSIGVDILVLGQYLQPTKQQIPVTRYVTPDEFEEYRRRALEIGFSAVVARPLARTSYQALEAWRAARLGKGTTLFLEKGRTKENFV